MTLPVVKHPTYSFTIPSLNVSKTFRPVLVAEERILLTAQETQDPNDFLRAVKQVINNCAIEPFEIDELAIFDVEWLFVQLRKVSISNVIVLTYEDGEDGKEYEVRFDIDEIPEPKIPADIKFTVQIDQELAINMTWPKAGLYGNTEIASDFDKLAAACIKNVTTVDSSVPVESNEETYKWIQTLPITAHNDIKVFFSQIPILAYETSYTNSKGTKRDIKLAGLSDFFGFR